VNNPIATGALADAITKALTDSVPGLEARVTRDEQYGLWLIEGRYKCPCGEFSYLRLAIFDKEVMLCRTPEYPAMRARELMEELRQHVRSEGNEPNF